MKKDKLIEDKTNIYADNTQLNNELLNDAYAEMDKMPNTQANSNGKNKTVNTKKSKRIWVRVAALAAAAVLVVTGVVLSGILGGKDNKMTIAQARELMNTVCIDLGLIEAPSQASVRSSNIIAANSVPNETNFNELEEYFKNELMPFDGSITFAGVYILTFKNLVDKCGGNTFYQYQYQFQYQDDDINITSTGKFYFELKEKAIVLNLYTYGVVSGIGSTYSTYSKATYVIKDTPSANQKWSLEGVAKTSIGQEVSEGSNATYQIIYCDLSGKIAYFYGTNYSFIADPSDELNDNNYAVLIPSTDGLNCTGTYANETNNKAFILIKEPDYSDISDDQAAYLLNYIQKAIGNFNKAYPAVDFSKVQSFTDINYEEVFGGTGE